MHAISRRKRRLHFQNDARPARRNSRNVAAKLDRVAKPLFRVQQNGLAGDTPGAVPQRLRKIALCRVLAVRSPIWPFMLRPAANEIAGQQPAQRFVVARIGENSGRRIARP